MVLLVAAFAAGFVDAIAGGGGLITVPALLASGVPASLILGTNKCAAASGSTAALWRYWRAGLIPSRNRKFWFTTILLMMVAGAVGARVSEARAVLDRLKYLVPLLLVTVMVYLVKRWFFSGPEVVRSEDSPVNEHDSAHSLSSASTRTSIAAVAAYDGLFGPGAGTFYLSVMERLGFSTLHANAIAKVLNLSSNLGALLLFAWHGRVIWLTGIPMGATYLCGNYLGSGFVLRRGQTLVRVTVLVTTAAILAKWYWNNR